MVGLLSPSDYAGYADEGRRLAVDVPNVTPMDAARFIAEATPIIGDAMAAKEIYDEATSENPNWAMVGALGGAAVLGLFPGIGDAAAKAVKSGARGLLDTAKRVEVDPNAMGSLLGNVRLKPKGDVADEATSFPVMQGRSRKGLDNFFNPDGLSWGTTSRETAEQFAGRNEVYWPNRTPPESSVEFSGDVYDLNFNLKNPMDVDISQTLWDRNKELALVSEAKSAGYDGLRISHPSGKVDYVAFDPSQVSRATPPSPAQEGSGLLAPAKPTAAELRRQANIQRFGYDPSEASAPPSRAATEDAGFESYLEQVNPGGKRIAAEDRPNLAMGDMYGMLPKGSEVVGSNNGVTFHRGSDGNYYATAFNPDVGEEDVIGYITNRGDGTELAVVQEMQGKGVGGELQYLFRNENPNAPTGGLTEAGEASLSKTYQRLAQEGLLAPSPAQEVADLLASGRADEVTDEMLGKLTPNDNMELFELYQSGATGMDLPMDEASRMARAEAMFPKDGFHGTNADIKGFQGNVFSSDNPTLASTYARGSADAQIYPLRLGSKLGDTVVEGGGVNWSQLDIGDVKDPAVAEWLDWAEGQKISTREIEQAAIREGRSGVQFKDINDTGPGFNSNQFKNLGYTKEQERALQKQYMENLSKPSNVDVRLSPNLVRSKFARFDPRLSNLKNLSAAVASTPGGLLALQEMQKRANEEQQRQGLLQ